jgi:beta-1,2-mannobiose phosphorylase / 1,2-beta-oligomannan phosphorylase
MTHGNSDGHYAMGALLLDAEEPARILGRAPEPILVATEEYERSGFYNNTVFSCGVVPLDHRSKRIRMYYGAADCRMAAADFDVEAIIASLAPC